MVPLDEGMGGFFSFLLFAGAAGCMAGICGVSVDECSNRYCNMKYVNSESVPVVIYYMTYLMFRGCRMRSVVIAPGRGIALPNADPVKAVKIEDMPDFIPAKTKMTSF